MGLNVGLNKDKDISNHKNLNIFLIDKSMFGDKYAILLYHFYLLMIKHFIRTNILNDQKNI